MRFPYLKIALAFIIGMILIAGPVYSQGNTPLAPNPVCNQIQQKVLLSLSQFCAVVDEGGVCYAANRVIGTPVFPTDNFFTQLGAKLPITSFKSIETTAVDTATQEWGIAAVNLGLLSNSSQDVELLLTGSARLEPASQTNETTAPINSFLFNTQDSSCTEAPSTVSIRVPENVKIDLVMNGATLNIGSTVTLRTVSPGNVMRMMTVEGSVTLQQPGAAPIVVPTGYYAERCLTQPQNLGADGQSNDQVVYDACGWTPAALATAEDTAIGQTVMKAFDGLSGTVCTNGGQNYVHTVVRGENLFRIARRYSKTVQQVAADNGLVNPDAIFVGQRLAINCGIDLNLSTQGQFISTPTSTIP